MPSPQLIAAQEELAALIQQRGDLDRQYQAFRDQQEATPPPQQPASPESEGDWVWWDADEAGAEEGGFEVLDVARAFVNFLPSLGENTAGIIKAVVSPVETVSGIVDLAGGVLEKMLDGLGVDKKDRYRYLLGDKKKGNRQRALVGQAIQFYKDRYGKDLRKTLTEDPSGALLDFAGFLTGGGAALKGAGAISRVSALGRLGQATQAAGAAISPYRLAASPIKAMAGRAPALSDKILGAPQQMRERAERFIHRRGSSMEQLYRASEKSKTEKDRMKKIAKEGIEPTYEEIGETGDRISAVLNTMGEDWKLAKSAIPDNDLDMTRLQTQAKNYLLEEWGKSPRMESVPTVKARSSIDMPKARPKSVGPREPFDRTKMRVARHQDGRIRLEDETLKGKGVSDMISMAEHTIMEHAYTLIHQWNTYGGRRIPVGKDDAFNLSSRLRRAIPNKDEFPQANKVVTALRNMVLDEMARVMPGNPSKGIKGVREVNRLWALKQELQKQMIKFRSNTVDDRTSAAAWLRNQVVTRDPEKNIMRTYIGVLEKEMDKLVMAPYAALHLSPIMPSIGLREVMYTAMSIGGHFSGNPWLFTGLIPLMSSSPRVQGFTARFLGASARHARRFERWVADFQPLVPNDLMERGLTYAHIMSIMRSRNIDFPDPPPTPLGDPDRPNTRKKTLGRYQVHSK